MDIEYKHKSLICAWVQHCRGNARIANLAKALLHIENLDNLWQYNLNEKDSKQIFVGNSFWHNVIIFV